jgi:hypothetical protein
MDERERIYHGQVYRLIEHRQHTCRDGRKVWLEVWRSRCTECGAAFECMRRPEWPVFAPRRRCDEHKAPGRKV